MLPIGYASLRASECDGPSEALGGSEVIVLVIVSSEGWAGATLLKL